VLLALCLSWFLLPLKEWISDLQSWFLDEGVYGVVIFVVVLVVMTWLPAPDWPLPIMAGYVYGVWAFPMVYISIVVASAVAFLAARHLARDKVRAFLRRRPRYRALDRAVAEHGWQMVFLVRLSPIIPFNLQNYAFGVTGVPLLPYLWATLAGITPGTALYVYFGIFGKGLSSTPSALNWVSLGLGVAASIALGVFVTRTTKTYLAEPNERRR